MENIIIVDNKIFESQQIEINLEQLEIIYTEKIESIARQQTQADEMLVKINYIKSLKNE